MEARLRLLIHQQQQHQLHQQLLQQQRLSHIQQPPGQPQQQQHVQNQNLLPLLRATRTTQHSYPSQSSLQASTNFNAQIAIRGFGALGGVPTERGYSLPFGSDSLPSLLMASNLAQFPAVYPTAHQPPQAATGVRSADTQAGAAVARMPESHGQVVEHDQPEMKDAEYFELFGFNDEDGVQIINETFPHKLYRMLYEVEKNNQGDIVSFFGHGKAFIVHQPKRFVGK